MEKKYDRFKGIPTIEEIEDEYRNNKLDWCKSHKNNCNDCVYDWCEWNKDYGQDQKTIY